MATTPARFSGPCDAPTLRHPVALSAAAPMATSIPSLVVTAVAPVMAAVALSPSPAAAAAAAAAPAVDLEEVVTKDNISPILDRVLKPEVSYSSRKLSYEQLMAEVEMHKERLVVYIDDFISLSLIGCARVLLTARSWPAAPVVAMGSLDRHNHPELIDTVLPLLTPETLGEMAVIRALARFGRFKDIEAILKKVAISEGTRVEALRALRGCEHFERVLPTAELLLRGEPLTEDARDWVIGEWSRRADHLPTFKAILEAPGPIPPHSIPDLIVSFAKSGEYPNTLALLFNYCPRTGELVRKAFEAALEGPIYMDGAPLVRKTVELISDFARLHGITLPQQVRQELFRTALTNAWIDFAELFYCPSFGPIFLCEMLTQHITRGDDVRFFERVYRDLTGLTLSQWQAIRRVNEKVIEDASQSVNYGSERQLPDRQLKYRADEEKRASERIAIHQDMARFLEANRPRAE